MFLRILTAILLPLNLILCIMYGLTSLLIGMIFWIITGKANVLGKFFKIGPERIIVWPLFIKNEEFDIF